MSLEPLTPNRSGFLRAGAMSLSMPKYLVHTQACPIPDALKYSGHPKDLLHALLSFSAGACSISPLCQAL